MHKPYILIFILIFSISGCANVENDVLTGETVSEWDFDHHVHFKKTILAEDHYQLEVITSSKVGFSRLATFLLRKSYRICGHYNYKLEMIQGIEGFDDRRAMPNYIHPSLMAKVECKPESTQSNN